jgi:membrane-associated phospholipid phosphatase
LAKSARIDRGERGDPADRRFRGNVHHPGTVQHRRHASDGLAAARLAGLAAGLFCALYVFAVGTPLGRTLDTAGAPDLDGPLDDALDRLVAAVNPLTVTLAVVVVIWLASRSGRPTDGIRAGALVAASALLAGELEVVLGRVDLLGAEAERELGAAFYPSGHATVAMSLALAILLVAPRRSRFALALAGAIWSSLLGFAICAGGSHHPSDVLGGFLLAFAVASIAAVGRPVLNNAAPRDRHLPTTVIAAVLGALVAVSLLLEVARRLSISMGSLHPPVLLAGVLLSAAAFVIVWAFASLVELG